MNFSRVQWKVDPKDGLYRKRTDSAGNTLPEDNWVWAPTGVVNIHYPELWGFVFFTDSSSPENSCVISDTEYMKWELRKLYYAQQICLGRHGHYCSNLHTLEAALREFAPVDENRSVKPPPFQIETTAHSFEISCRTDGHCVSIFSDGRTEIR